MNKSLGVMAFSAWLLPLSVMAASGGENCAEIGYNMERDSYLLAKVSERIAERKREHLQRPATERIGEDMRRMFSWEPDEDEARRAGLLLSLKQMERRSASWGCAIAFPDSQLQQTANGNQGGVKVDDGDGMGMGRTFSD